MTPCSHPNPQSAYVRCCLPAGHLAAHVVCLGTHYARVKLLAVWSGGTITIKRVPVELYEGVMRGLVTGRYSWTVEEKAREVEEV